MRQKIQILIPLVLLAAFQVYCWTIFWITDFVATWRHYVGIILYLITVVVFFKGLRLAAFIVGLYLILGTFNLLAITPEIKTSWINIGPLSTPPVQLLSLGLFILYFILNFNSLIEYYLDYKEAKQATIQNPKN
jgi:hypothetical protein